MSILSSRTKNQNKKQSKDHYLSTKLYLTIAIQNPTSYRSATHSPCYEMASFTLIIFQNNGDDATTAWRFNTPQHNGILQDWQTNQQALQAQTRYKCQLRHPADEHYCSDTSVKNPDKKQPIETGFSLKFRTVSKVSTSCATHTMSHVRSSLPIPLTIRVHTSTHYPKVPETQPHDIPNSIATYAV